jgi:methyl coenzyme M reductase alpha subunit
VIHIYEIDSGRGIYWEVWKDIIGEAWGEKYIRTLEDENEMNLYLDILRDQGSDFVIHTLEEYEEYHVLLS